MNDLIFMNLSPFFDFDQVDARRGPRPRHDQALHKPRQVSLVDEAVIPMDFRLSAESDRDFSDIQEAITSSDTPFIEYLSSISIDQRT